MTMANRARKPDSEPDLARAMHGNRAAIQAADESLEAARQTLAYARLLSERIRVRLGPGWLHDWPSRASQPHDR